MCAREKKYGIPAVKNALASSAYSLAERDICQANWQAGRMRSGPRHVTVRTAQDREGR